MDRSDPADPGTPHAGARFEVPVDLPPGRFARRHLAEIFRSYAEHHRLLLADAAIDRAAKALADRLGGRRVTSDELGYWLRRVGCRRYLLDSSDAPAVHVRARGDDAAGDIDAVLRGNRDNDDVPAVRDASAGISPQALLHTLVERFDTFVAATPEQNEHVRQVQELARLHDRHRSALLEKARRLVGSDDAEDVVQDTWVRVHAALRRHHVSNRPPLDATDNGLRRYLYRTLANAAQTVLRRRGKVQVHPPEDLDDIVGSGERVQLVGTSDSPAPTSWHISSAEARSLAPRIEWVRTQVRTVVYTRWSPQRELALAGLEALAFEYDRVVATNSDRDPIVAAVWYAAFVLGQVEDARMRGDDSADERRVYRAAKKLRAFLVELLDIEGTGAPDAGDSDIDDEEPR